MSKAYLVHAKGQEWRHHKYIRKEGNRYIYKEDLPRTQQRATVNNQLDNAIARSKNYKNTKMGASNSNVTSGRERYIKKADNIFPSPDFQRNVLKDREAAKRKYEENVKEQTEEYRKKYEDAKKQSREEIKQFIGNVFSKLKEVPLGKFINDNTKLLDRGEKFINKFINKFIDKVSTLDTDIEKNVNSIIRNKVKPVEVKPAEVKPVEVKPAEVKPVEINRSKEKPSNVKIWNPKTNTWDKNNKGSSRRRK